MINSQHKTYRTIDTPSNLAGCCLFLVSSSSFSTCNSFVIANEGRCCLLLCLGTRSAVDSFRLPHGSEAIFLCSSPLFPSNPVDCCVPPTSNNLSIAHRIVANRPCGICCIIPLWLSHLGPKISPNPPSPNLRLLWRLFHRLPGKIDGLDVDGRYGRHWRWFHMALVVIIQLFDMVLGCIDRAIWLCEVDRLTISFVGFDGVGWANVSAYGSGSR